MPIKAIILDIDGVIVGEKVRETAFCCARDY